MTAFPGLAYIYATFSNRSIKHATAARLRRARGQLLISRIIWKLQVHMAGLGRLPGTSLQ